MTALADLRIEKIPAKRRHIYQTLRHEILSRQLSPGSPIPSAYVLAQQFGVSYVTMHSALADLVRDGLLVRHKGKGTFTADTKAEKKRPNTARLVLVVPPQDDIDAYGQVDNFMQMVNGCCAGATTDGVNLSIIRIPSIPEQQDIQWAVTRVMVHDGALFLGNQYNDLMLELKERGFLCLSVCGEGAPVSTTEFDLPASVRTALAHVLAHGYRRIGFFGNQTSPWAKRYEVFREYLTQHGVPLDENSCRHCPWAVDPQPYAGRFLTEGTLPEVVLVDDQTKALTLMMLARERGVRIPEQLAVLAFGADTAGCARAQLTIMKAPYEEMGREGETLLDRMIRGAVLPPVHKMLSARLVIRRSCGCEATATTAETRSRWFD